MPELQTQVVDTVYEKIQPQQSVKGDSSIVTFKVHGNDYFLDVHNTELVLECKYTDNEHGDLGEAIKPDEKGFRRSYAESNLAHTLWQSAEVRINDVDIKSSLWHDDILRFIHNNR